MEELYHLYSAFEEKTSESGVDSGVLRTFWESDSGGAMKRKKHSTDHSYNLRIRKAIKIRNIRDKSWQWKGKMNRVVHDYTKYKKRRKMKEYETNDSAL